MIEKYNQESVNIQGRNLGEAWINMVKKIITTYAVSFDEDRGRVACQSIRFRSESHGNTEPIFKKYADKNNIKKMDEMFFSRAKMVDFDVSPSFSPGAKSYYQRILEGKMVEFVVERLSAIPESKKAVMIFPTYEDYKQVLENQKDDYLPCLVAFQVRLQKRAKGYKQNVYFFMRSWDAYQKAPGNLVAMAKLSDHIRKKLQKRLKKNISLGIMEGMVTDAHIYEECLPDAKKLVKIFAKRKIGYAK